MRSAFQWPEKADSTRYQVLSPQAQPSQYATIPLRLRSTEICKQPSPVSHHLHEPTAGTMVLFVDAQVLRKLTDTSGQDGYLDLRRTCVAVMMPMLVDELLLLLFANHSLAWGPAPYLLFTLYILRGL